MSKDPAFLFYPNDYIGGTMGMTKVAVVVNHKHYYAKRYKLNEIWNLKYKGRKFAGRTSEAVTKLFTKWIESGCPETDELKFDEKNLDKEDLFTNRNKYQLEDKNMDTPFKSKPDVGPAKLI